MATKRDAIPPSADKAKAHQFQKGKSGNPGGRPKAIKEAIEHAKQNVPLLLDMLFGIAMSPAEKTADRIAASREYLDRALGKPPQSLQHSGNITSHEDALKAIADDLIATGDEGPAEARD